MTESTLLRVAQICLELDRPQSTDSLKRHLDRVAAIFQTPNYVLGVRGAVNGRPVEAKLTNYPQEWQEYYDKNNLHFVNPYIRRANDAFGAFRWDDVKTNEKEEEYKVKLAQYGMVHGMVCTVKTLDSFMGLVIFNGKDPLPRHAWQEQSLAVNLFCNAATRASAYCLKKPRIESKSPAIQLSAAEKNCLELSARGLTARQVGVELGIPERTVRHHMDVSARKLNVRTRREALAEALSQGLIRRSNHDQVKIKGEDE